ncbi:MAG: hypothetical protein H6733_06455 [Alphaproteobacteria bacterium]|nr:hypothetical protein [Alphaproteobacteria bacterium]
MPRLTPLVLVLAATSVAHAADPDVLVTEGDAVAGLGNVTSVSNIAVNDLGDFHIEIDTDNTNTDADGAVLGPLGIVLTEGQSLTAPPGAMIGSFDSMPLNNIGQASYNHFLDGTTGTSDDSGIYVDDQLVIQESDLATYPTAGVGTPYIGFFDSKINDNGEVIVVASVDDPGISSTVDRVLVRLTPDGLGGFTQAAIAAEGDVLTGQTESVTDFETDAQEYAWSNTDHIFFNAALTGDTTRNNVLYYDTTIVAQEGDPSPISGRNYESLSSKPIDLSDLGDTIFRANLDGDTADDEVIVLNGSVVAQEGGTLDGIGAGFAITGFGSGPVEVGNNGNWVVFADWDDPDTTVDTGLFVNGKLLLQEGDTLPGGQVVDDIRGITEGYDLSDDGGTLLVRVVFTGSLDAVLRYDLSDQLLVGEVTPAIAGQANRFRVERASPFHQVALVWGTAGGVTSGTCGGGTLSVGIAGAQVLGVGVTGPTGTIGGTRPAPPSLAGQTVLLQAIDLTSCVTSPIRTVTFP